jgi:hypothetical protein
VVSVVRKPIEWCKSCNVVHSGNGGVCPRVQARVDSGETERMTVARSWFAQWASGYLASIVVLAHAGVQVGKDR